MPNKNYGIRLPGELVVALKAYAQTQGVSFASVIINACKAYLEARGAMVPPPPDHGHPDLEARVTVLENRIGTLEAKHDAQPPARQDAPPPARQDARQDGPVSDTTLRRLHRRLGGGQPLEQWAMGEGWVRDGKGNRAKWYRTKQQN